MYQWSHTSPKSKPCCFKIYSASNTGHRGGALYVKWASSHRELLMNKILPSLRRWSFFPLAPLHTVWLHHSASHLARGQSCHFNTSHELDTQHFWALSTRLATCTCRPHFPARVKSSWRATWYYGWHLPWTSVYSHRSHPPQVKYDHHLKPWEGLRPLTFSLSQWLPQARVIPFYSFFWEASFPQVT